MVTDSTMTGLTLPGMIDEPGCTAGISSSARLARGPLPISRMSPAILYSDTATLRRAPLADTTLSSVACDWKWLSLSAKATPVASASRAITRLANSGCMPTPIRLGQEFLGYVGQVERARRRCGDVDRGRDDVVAGLAHV